MAERTSLTLYRNSDVKVTYSLPKGYNLDGFSPAFYFRTAEGEAPTLTVTPTPTGNGSSAVIVGSSVVLVVKAADSSSFAVQDIFDGVYDSTLTKDGFVNRFVGGPMTVYVDGSYGEGVFSDAVFITLSGLDVPVIVEGGNLGIAAAADLQAINQAVIDANQAAAEAEAAAITAVAATANKLDLDGDNVGGNAPSLLVNIGAVGSTALAAGTGGTLVGYQANGTGSTLRTIQQWMRERPVSVREFGNATMGNGTQDDTAFVQAAFNSGNKNIIFGEGFTYRITNTVTVPDGTSVDFCTSKLLYDGTRDRAAFVFGSSVASSTEVPCRNVWVESSVQDFSNDAFVGAKFINCQRNDIHIYRVSKFTRAVEFLSKDQGVTGVTCRVNFIGSAKYALTTTVDNDGVGSPSYVNGNYIFIEDWTQGASPNGNVHGWHLRDIGAVPEGQNGNHVYFQGMQPGNGTSGDIRNAALFDGTGGQNILRVERLESGRGPIAIFNGPVGDGTTASPIVAGNKVQVGLVAQAGGAILSTLQQTGSARANIIEWLHDTVARQDDDRVDDLVKKVKGYNSGALGVSGGIHYTTGDGNPRLFQSGGGIETDRDSLRLGGADRSMGRFVDCEGGDTWMIMAKTRFGSRARLFVAPYDADGNRLASGGTPPASVLIKSDPEVGVYNRWNTNLGGCYMTGSTVDKWVFTTDATVKRLRYGVYGGNVQSFKIVRLSPSEVPVNGYSGLDTNDAYYVGATPTGSGFGLYGRGDVALLDSASGSDLSAFQFTLGGRYAPQWVASTLYSAGQLRLNDSNKIYEVMIGGTSAGSGGPTGTGSSIVDNGVTWRYVCPLAVVTALTPLTATQVFDPGSLATNASTALQTVTVTGASLGDAVSVSFSLDAAGVQFTGYVSAADTVKYWATNLAGANPVDLASGTVRVKVRKV